MARNLYGTTDSEEMVGRFFSLREFTSSGTATRLELDNTPNRAQKAAIRALVANVLDPLRAHLGRSVRISGGFRSLRVNQSIPGAAENSWHMLGQAADISVDGMSGLALATLIVQLGLPFDQLIWYAPERSTHVHVAFTATGLPWANRQQTKHAPAGGGYVQWTPDVSPRGQRVEIRPPVTAPPELPILPILPLVGALVLSALVAQFFLQSRRRLE